MFGFHKPKMYRSLDGCCICRAKSSSSRFTDSKRYERDFHSCFGLSEVRFGEICNACVLLVKRWKKLPAESIKNWNHVVDAKGSGSSWKTTVRSKKMKMKRGARPSQISRVQKELKRRSKQMILCARLCCLVRCKLWGFKNSDAHSTTSSASPAHSPSYSNISDEGSDVELSPGATHSPVFSFLDLTYWKRQKVCCGIIYKGRFGEVLLDPHLYKPCCQKKRQHEPEEEAQASRANVMSPTPPNIPPTPPGQR
ncbi:SIN3-HDAC complex-associated factor-like isoform X1 [Salvelinus alpinus]|uniref:SIN3-HDAC complex-associated factor-like isoform X1 n=1 Tax=Salvelinus alpinus TaxID=8036 RepID=UPI0039FD07C3